MAMLVWLVSAVGAIYGLGWIVFAFVNPPSFIGYLYRSPSMFYFLSERGGRFAMAGICFGVSVFASVIIPMFWG